MLLVNFSGIQFALFFKKELLCLAFYRAYCKTKINGLILGKCTFLMCFSRHYDAI